MTHPLKNDIVKMLTQGQSVKDVEQYITENCKDKKLHITFMTLQKFRKEKLDMDKEAINKIKKVAQEKKEIKEYKKGETNLRKLPAYQEAISKALDKQLDIRTELSEMIILIKERIRDLFDRAQAGETTINEEANLQKYFPILGATLDKWMKYIEKVADHTIETNVNITVIEDQMLIMREAVKDTLQEMEPELALKFMDKLNERMNTLNYTRPPRLEFDKIQEDAHKLSNEIKQIEGEIDGNEE